MGLAVQVGLLAYLASSDDEDAREYFEREFETLNRQLAALGLPAHVEPRECDLFSSEMYGYSGLHHLRRLAAHIDAARPLPPPGDGDSSNDPLLQAYYEAHAGPPGRIGRLFRRRSPFSRSFDHLLIHSDADGFYLLLDFERVLIIPEAAGSGMVGSTPRLLAELDRIARLLDIPPTLRAGSDELNEAIDSPGQGADLWHRYAIETLSCVTLREACHASLATGAAIVFT